MSQIVKDAIAEELALLTRVTPEPLEPLGYGTDLSCVEDITEDLAEVDQDSPLGVAQAVARRLITPRGGLPDDPSYGLDIRGYANRGVTIAEQRDLASQIRAEVTKDDRVADAVVTVTVPSLDTMSVRLQLTPEDPNLAPFALTFAVKAGQLMLEELV